MTLSDQIHAHTSPEQRNIMAEIAAYAQQTNTPVCLVGGAVRDALMARPIGDLDFVVEGDAIGFVKALHAQIGADVVTHEKFRTATLTWQGLLVDFTTARVERYLRPAALPNIKAASIDQDLPRRDFSINAMAYLLNDNSLRDPFHGADDIQHGLIRTLHAQSFVDDPTRILRAARYAARFGFGVEPQTLLWLKRGLPYVPALSGERIKYDLEHIFCEAQPEIGLGLLKDWGVFAALGIAAPDAAIIHQRYQHARAQLTANDWKLDTLNLTPTEILRALGWAVLVYNQGQMSASRWLDRIPFTNTLRDAIVALGPLSSLSRVLFQTKPSQQSELLRPFGGLALWMAYLFDPDPAKRQAMRTEWHNWRWVRPISTGDDLRKLGILPGPAYATILAQLRAAWLDGEISSVGEEELRITN